MFRGSTATTGTPANCALYSICVLNCANDQPDIRARCFFLIGRDAEIIAEYAGKGSALAFNGRLQTDSYVDREGQQRTSTFLIADSFEFVPTAKRAEENGDGNGEAHDEVSTKANDDSQEAPEEEAGAEKPKRRTKRKTIAEDEIPF